MTVTIPDQRILAGTAGQIRTTWTGSDGEPAAPPDPVEVHVVRADGTTLLGPDHPAVLDGVTDVTAAVTAAHTATLDLLTATWTGPDDERRISRHEIVGRVFFTIAQARLREDLADDRYPDALVAAQRTQVEARCEDITGVAWVPRFRHVRLDGPGHPELQLPDRRLRTIRWLRIHHRAGPEDLTGADIDALTVYPDGRVIRPRGWPSGLANIEAGYEHGEDQPPPDLRDAAILHLRYLLHRPRSAMPDRASTVTDTEGRTYRLERASAWTTGIPDVDAVYQAHSRRPPAGAASQPFDYDPQRHSIFHGGRR